MINQGTNFWKLKNTLFFLLVFLCSTNVLQANLFDSEEVLELKIVANFSKLLNTPPDSAKYFPVTLMYQDSVGRNISFSAKIKSRGHSRQIDYVCNFPPLWIKVSRSKAIRNTLFEGQKKLKLVTHCRNTKGFDQYLIKEYLTYKIYQLLTPSSFKVRLVKITYHDLRGKEKAQTQFGFLMEDIGRMAIRIQAEKIKQEVLKSEKIKEKELLGIALFQYMIGNTDWGISSRHNVKVLLKKETQHLIIIPYDFDWSGLVDAPYAKPHPQFGLTSVRQRVYQGGCYNEEELEEAFQIYEEKKEMILEVFRRCKYLEKRVRKDCLKYLNVFFSEIDDEEKTRKVFYRNCGE